VINPTSALVTDRASPSDECGIDVVAFHLPQFHPVPENDAWWGAGFSEWRNVAKAKPLFRGHDQPLLPGDLGFYDLRLVESHAAQIALAKEAGLTAFCYYHYWFAGKTLLENQSNCSVTIRNSISNTAFVGLITVGPAIGLGALMKFCWRRPIREKQTTWPITPTCAISLKIRDTLGATASPCFVFRPEDIPDVDQMRRLTSSRGLMARLGCFSSLIPDRRFLSKGFEAIAPHSFNDAMSAYLSTWHRGLQWMKSRLLRYPRWTVDYARFVRYFRNREMDGLSEFPTAVPNWDNTPRVGRRGVVLRDSNPEKFYNHLVDSSESMRASNTPSRRLLFIKSWNEWAEGNHLEPDLKTGKGWITATRRFVDCYCKPEGARRERR
jgi:hypothetical protein